MNANANRLRRRQSPLAKLPGLAVHIELPGGRSVRGAITDVGDGRVVVELVDREMAKLLVDSRVALLTVHAPGVRFEATARPAGSVTGHAVALVVDAGPGRLASA